MNNDSRNKYLMLQTQRDQLALIEKEANEESSHLHLIAMTDKEIPLTEEAQSDSKSITRQISEYYKTLSGEEKDVSMTFICIDNTFNDFKEYLLGKYSGKKKLEWEVRLNNVDYANDVKRLFKTRIYRHKVDSVKSGKSSFCSPTAHNQCQLYELLKRTRASIHEAVNRQEKIAVSNGMHSPLNEEDRNFLLYENAKIWERELGNVMPDRQFECRTNTLQLT